MSGTPEITVDAVRITTKSGAVRVTADAGLHEVIADGLPIGIDDSTVTIAADSSRANVRVPEGMDLVIGSTSGRVVVHGRAGAVAVVTTSGRVDVDDAETVDVRTSSGRVKIGRSRGEARVVSRSGRVEIGHSGSADVSTTHGRVTLRDVAGPARAHCSSGRIDISMAGAHDVDAETISGRISISLPAGVRARIDTPSAGAVAVSGGHDCVVTARSGSGRVDVDHR